MKFGGMIISSLEYPGKMSLVIFTSGCEFRCPYCHNPELINNGEDVEIEEIFLEIEDSIDFIDSVVISGGEPLCQSKAVKSILEYCKTRGLNTKLDTNGYSPKNLKKIIELIDYVALDIKAPFDKYEEIIGRDNGNEVEKSMNIAFESSDTYLECRTTYVPGLMNPNDIIEIAKSIKCDRYTIQQFRNKAVLDEELHNTPNPSRNELIDISKSIKPFLDDISIKTAEFGNETIKSEGIDTYIAY